MTNADANPVPAWKPMLLPQSKAHFDRCFPSEQACQEYVQHLRWPEGFRCSACGGTHAWLTRRGLMRCAKCQRQCSITAGTVFEGTRKPLRDWLHAIWYVVGRESGVSALDLQRELNLHSYQTAWTWLHRLRQAMVGGQARLRGEVQAGQVALDGPRNGGGRQSSVIIAAAAEVDGPAVGCIRLRQISGGWSGEWEAFLKDAIAPETPVQVVSASIPERRRINHVQRVASALDRWLRRTYCGAIDPFYLAYYLDEFTFRVNHRRSSSRAELFHILLSEAIRRPPEPHRPPAAGKAAAEQVRTHAPWASLQWPAGAGSSALQTECQPPGVSPPIPGVRGEQEDRTL